METWRILATALLGFPGLLGVLMIMAKARDRTGRSSTVAVSGLVSATALAVLAVLVLTVLPAVPAWSLAAAVAVAVAVLVLAS
ncbi:hypothetical protein [Qaidamihabitans albus]|uniref:hypothetical protein n=1 Tax=Qaidamihabitans albus TaxID=2795733 RepID=UPI0018F168DD|nr:hypothetical protein [Qaidamihabitans albus]